MKLNSGKIISHIGNVVTVLSILSALSKIQSVTDIISLITSLGNELEQIIMFFGRVVHLVIEPWDNLLNKIFSFFPWSIPNEWQNFTVLFTLSFNYPFQLFLGKLIHFGKAQELNKLNKILGYYYKINNEDLNSDYHKAKELVFNFIKDNNLLIVGPISEYLVISRSNVPRPLKKKCLMAAEKYLIEYKKHIKKQFPEQTKSKKWSRKLFIISFIILIAIIIDKFRLGYSNEFIVYGLKGLLIIVSATLAGITLIVLLSTVLLLVYFSFYRLYFFISAKKASKSLKKLFLESWMDVQKSNEEFKPKNVGIGLYGNEIKNIEEYLTTLKNDGIEYEAYRIVLYRY